MRNEIVGLSKESMSVCLASIALAMALTSRTALGQYATASLAGTVTDQSGASIPGAKVTVQNSDTGFTQDFTTEAEGAFLFPRLPVGNYRLMVERAGFATYVREAIGLTVGQAATVDVKMRLGEVTEKVTVQADADMINLRTATTGELIDEKKIVDLPLNGRQPQTLVYLAPSTMNLGRTGFTPGGSNAFVTPAISGTGMQQVNYQMDGGGNNETHIGLNQPFPNPDAVQEFNIQTSNFTAEYGQAGGGIVNIVTKSGTNSIHGSLFEFLRNGALNARNFFAVSPDTLKRNQFGGAIGGPIIKDKLFYFGTYQGARGRTAPTGQVAFVPTAAEREGDFSGLSTPIIDPITQQAFPGNVIPSGRLSPVTKFILKYFPLPNRAGRELDFTGTKIVQTEDQAMGKVDYKRGKLQLNGRYLFNNYNRPAEIATENVLAADFNGENDRVHTVAVNHTYTVSPTLLINGSFAFNRALSRSDSSAPFSYPEAGVKIASSAEGVLKARPEIELFAPGFFVYSNHRADFKPNDITVRENLTLIKGGHELHFGGEVVRLTRNILNSFFQDGAFDFSGQFTGDYVADFMLGRAVSFNQGGGEFKNLSGPRIGLYAQDNWRVNRRLNLNLGLRWDPYFQAYDHDGRVVCFQPGARSNRYPNAPAGLIYGGPNPDPGCPERGADNTLASFAPRLGFAYRITEDGRTALRGGFGYYYSPPPTGQTNAFSNVAPFSPQIFLSDVSFEDPYGSAGVANPFPAQYGPSLPGPEAAFVLPTGINYLDKNFRLPLFTIWSLSLERQLGQSWRVKAGYTGNKGTHLFYIFQRGARDVNAAIYIPGNSTVGNTQARRPNEDFSNIFAVESTHNSNYHSLELLAEKRFGYGLSLLTHYTWSKKLDDLGGLYAAGTNPFDRRFDYGLANEDVPHNFRFTNVWEVPKVGAKGFTAKILNGWMVNSIVTWQSGVPFSVLSGVDHSFSGVGRDRADYVGGNATLDSGRPHGELILQYFNTSVFTVNREGTFGNSGRNILRGPRYFNTDFSILKNTSISDGKSVQFRAEFFNAFNNVNFGLPNSTLSSGSQFGRITSAFDPRIVQFGLKFLF